MVIAGFRPKSRRPAGPAARLVRWITATAVVAATAFLAYGSWRTGEVLDRLLKAGSPTVQNYRWPEQETPADIGFVGDPQAAFGYAFEDVALDTDIGPMPAWLVLPEPATARSDVWVVVVHGIGGRRENGYRFLPILRDAGLPTMLIAYRNDRDAPLSAEGYYAFGLTEWRDVEAAVRHALSNGAGSVILLGESMGGGIVGQFLRRSDLRDRVSALLFDAPALDFPSILQAQMRRAGAPLPHVLGPGGMLLFGLRTGIDIADTDVVATIVDFGGPVFVSHGAGDRIVPVATTDGMVKRRTGVTEYLRTGADHILSFREDPERYRAALSAFLRTVAPARGE